MGKWKRSTNEEKLAIARQVSLPGSTIASVARANGLTESTVRGWVKNLDALEKISTESNAGSSKANHKDKMPNLTMGLKAFCERARRLRPPVPITVETITVKAKELSAKLLNAYDQCSNKHYATTVPLYTFDTHAHNSVGCFLRRSRNLRRST